MTLLKNAYPMVKSASEPSQKVRLSRVTFLVGEEGAPGRAEWRAVDCAPPAKKSAQQAAAHDKSSIKVFVSRVTFLAGEQNQQRATPLDLVPPPTHQKK